jgi:hypothetical protein
LAAEVLIISRKLLELYELWNSYDKKRIKEVMCKVLRPVVEDIQEKQS